MEPSIIPPLNPTPQSANQSNLLSILRKRKRGSPDHTSGVGSKLSKPDPTNEF
jgi:hypothetical protein